MAITWKKLTYTTDFKTINGNSIIGTGDLTISGAGGGSTTKTVVQSSHGLSVGDIVKVSGADTYAKAQADSAANAEVIGIVTNVADLNNYTLTLQGEITTGVPTATAGTVYFLSASSAGAITSTEPSTVGNISKPCLIVTQSATKALFVNMRGMEITATTDNATKSGTETITNKRNQPRVYNTTTLSTLTPEIASYDMFELTAQAGALTIANHSTSTPVAGEKMAIRIKDSGSARAISFGTYYRGSTNIPLPTTTTISKTLYMGFIWNVADTKWDLLATSDLY